MKSIPDEGRAGAKAGREAGVSPDGGTEGRQSSWSKRKRWESREESGSDQGGPWRQGEHPSWFA